MKVEAVRDDGAVLVSNGRRAAAIASPDGVWLTTVDAALARGEWCARRGGPLPPDTQDLAARIGDLDRMLDRDQPEMST